MMDINTKRSFTEITTTTPTHDFSVGFDFYEKLDRINVLVDNVSAVGNGYTVVLSNPTTIHITPAVATGKVVRMERETDIDDTKFKFTAGAEFDADHVDQNFEQILHSQQEVRDNFQRLADRTYPLVEGIETALERAETQANAASASADAAAASAASAALAAVTVSTRNIKMDGAIGDGTLHKVQEWTVIGSNPYYPNLSAIQVVYPHVTSLNDSIDWAAIQKTINTFHYSDTSTISPNTSPNGGSVIVPRGRFVVGNDKLITLKRGVFIIGESRESSQIYSKNTNGLFKYDDLGRYLPDELGLQNLYLLQDSTVVPTSGAGILIRSTGLVPESSVSPVLRNLLIEGFYVNLNVGDCINAVFERIDQSKAITYGGMIDNVTFSTSSSLSACYAHSNGLSGWYLKGLYYVSLMGMASDSNGTFGYELDTCRGLFLHGGAEANTQKALKLSNSYGSVLVLSAVNNLTGAIELSNSFYTVIQGGMLVDNRVGSTQIAITGLASANYLEVSKGVDFEGSYTTNRITGVNNYDDRALTTAIGSNGKNWQLGVNQALQTLSQFFFGGVTSDTTQNGLDLQPNFAKAVGSINKTLNILFRAVSTDTFPVAVGAAIGNAIISGGGTIARKIGMVIDTQTGGTSATAGLHLTDGTALSVGNWSLFNSQSNDSYFKSKIRFGATAATAPYLTSGTGAPADASAPQGSIYVRTDGVAGTSLYVKIATGWVAATLV